jgi:tetratricopeptide (TPR) repeat protein
MAWTMAGCQVLPSPATPAKEGEPSTLARQCAHVNPRQMDPSLTDEQLGKMFLPFDQVPLAEVSLPGDPNTPPRAASPAQDDSTDLSSAKIYLRARTLLTAGLYLSAAQTASAQILRDPGNAALLQLLTQAQFLGGDVDNAAKNAAATLRLKSDSLTAWQVLGSIAQNRSQHPEAAWFFKRALNTPDATVGNPITAILHLQLGSSLMQMDYLSAAIEHYQTGSTLLLDQAAYAQANPLMKKMIPQLHLPLLTLASLQAQIGHIDQAVEELHKTEALLAPDTDLMRAFILSLATQKAALHIRYQRVMAFCQYLIASRQDPEESLKLFQQACQSLAKQTDFAPQLQQWSQISVAGENLLPPKLHAYGLTLDGRFEQALEILQQTLAKTPGDSEIHIAIARIDAQIGRWEGMVTHGAAFLEAQPGRVDEVLDPLSFTAEKQPQLAAFIQNAPADGPIIQSAWGCFLMGRLAEQAGQPDAADAFYSKALDLKKDFAPSMEQLLDLRVRRQQFDRALSLLQSREEQFQANTRILSLTAQACTGIGRFDDARRYYQRILSQDSNDIDVYLRLGENFYLQNHFPAAEDVLLRTLDRWPDSEEIDRQLFILYARWNAEPDLPASQAEATLKQTRTMFARWINRKKEDLAGASVPSAQSEKSWQRVTEILESLSRQFPRGKAIHILWSEYLAARGKLDQAVAAIENLLKAYPDDDLANTLAAEFNQRNSVFTREAEIRTHLVRLHPEEPEYLADALRALRRAERTDRAIELLQQSADKPAMLTLTAVGLLQNEALKLFQIARQYPQAVKLFQTWHRIALATANPNESQQMIAIEAGKNLIWSLSQISAFDRAEQYAVAQYLQYPRKSLDAVIGLIRELNIRMLYPQSLRLIDSSLAITPDQPILRLERYRALIDDQKPDDAIAGARGWLDQKQDEKIRQNIFILTLMQAARFGDLEQYLRGRLKIQSNPDLGLQLVDVLTITGRYPQAEEELNAITPDPKDPLPVLEAHIKLDIAQDQYTVAMVRLNKLALSGKDTVLIDRWIIDILAAAGQTDKAIDLNEKLIAKTTDNVTARLQQTLFLERAGKVDQAITELEKLAKEFPDNSLIKNNLGYLLVEHDQDIDRAGRLLRQAYQDDPLAASTLDSLGWFYYKEGDFETALQYLYQSAALMPNTDFEIWEHLGDVLCRLGRPQEARRYWLKAQNDLNRRMSTEKYLSADKSRIDNKLQQADDGEMSAVTPLFHEYP